MTEVRRRRWTVFGVVLFCATTPACRRPAAFGELIDKYKAATCVPPLREAKHIIPKTTREWEHQIDVGDGAHAVISGAQMPGGRINLEYGPGDRIVAASAGDYVYPADVRYDRDTGRLYVKAEGLAVGIWDETWVIGFDVRGRREIGRLLVDRRVMPGECGPQ